MASIWLDDLAVSKDFSLAGNFTGLLAKFAPAIQGYVLCDVPTLSHPNMWALARMQFLGQPRPVREHASTMLAASASVNVALSLAAAHGDLVVVALTDEAKVAALGIPLKYDARNFSAMDVLTQFAFNKRTAVLQDPSKYDFLPDYSVFAGAFSWFDTTPGITGPVSLALLASLSIPGAVLGWGPTEGNTVDTLSKHGSYIHAADYAPNLASLSSFHVPLVQQRLPTPQPAAKNKHTVCFLMTDGDNIQWLLDTFAVPGKKPGACK